MNVTRRRNRRIGLRHTIGLLACAAVLLAPASASAHRHSVGSHEQIAWVRRAANNFLAAELAGNGAGACSILNVPLRATQGHETCEQRWNELARRGTTFLDKIWMLRG